MSDFGQLPLVLGEDGHRVLGRWPKRVGLSPTELEELIAARTLELDGDQLRVGAENGWAIYRKVGELPGGVLEFALREQGTSSGGG